MIRITCPSLKSMGKPGKPQEQNAWGELRNRAGFCSLVESIKNDLYLARSSREILREMQEPNVRNEINASQCAYVARMLEFDQIECLIIRLARMTTDSNNRSASLRNVSLALKDDNLTNELREYVSNYDPAITVVSAGGDPGPLSKGAMDEFKRLSEEGVRRDREKLRCEFDQELSVCNERLKLLLSPISDASYRVGWDRQLKALKQARNKSVAHKDLSADQGILKSSQIPDFNIEWNTVDYLLETIQPIIQSLEYMCHGSDGTHLVEFTFFAGQEAKKFWAHFARS